MWKFILCAILFLSASCFAYSNFAEFPAQFSIDQDLEDAPEGAVIVNIDEIEDLIEEINRARISKPERVKIWFVNNLNALPGNGSYKNPFNTLLAAQEASKRGDIIFVFPGDNTTKGMDQGFVMKKKAKTFRCRCSSRH